MLKTTLDISSSQVRTYVTSIRPGHFNSMILSKKNLILDKRHKILDLTPDNYTSRSRKLIVALTHNPRKKSDFIEISKTDFMNRNKTQFGEFHEVDKALKVNYSGMDSPEHIFCESKEVIKKVDDKSKFFHGTAYDDDE